MSSTFVNETTDSSTAENTVIIIVNDDTGNISVDQEMLQHLLISQENTTLSVVRVNDECGENNTDVNLTVEGIFTPTKKIVDSDNTESCDTANLDEGRDVSSGVEVVKMLASDNLAKVPHGQETGKIGDGHALDPLLDLDQEEIEKIEHALQSEQARQILDGSFGGILSQNAAPELDDLLDPELTGAPDHNEVVATISLDHSYSSIHGPPSNFDNSMSSEIDDSSDSTTPVPGKVRGPRCFSPKRRSQRQIDRQELEQLRRIRAENEEMLKKEKQEMNRQTPVKNEADSVDNADVTANILTPSVGNIDSDPVKVEPVQPISRLSAIRQEMQQKILAIDPVTPYKSKTNDATVKSKSPASKPAARLVVTPNPSPEASKVNQLSNSAPQKQEDGPNLGSGGVARPRRENRQPPKHLREAFHQLDSEVIGFRKTTPKAVKEVVEEFELQTTPQLPKKATKKKLNSTNTQQPPQNENGKSPLPEVADVQATATAAAANDDVDDSESGDSWNSEDDPDRLWCICREPHNNRFMICCDKCEDWFHGKCVGLTRGMGRELELKGLEWICPKCVRQEQEQLETVNEQEKTTKDKVGEDPAPADVPKVKEPTNKRTVRLSSGGSGEDGTRRKCVISSCKNEARANSIYCSDACIVSHARDSLVLMSKEKLKQEKPVEQTVPTSPVTPTSKSEPVKLKESVEFGKLMSQATPQPSKSKAINQLRKSSSSSDGRPSNLTDDTPVPVMERKSGKILSGSLAPVVGTLEQWLKDNPTYEVIKPALLPKSAIKHVPKVSTQLTPKKMASPVAKTAPSPVSLSTPPSSVSSSASATQSTPSQLPSKSPKLKTSSDLSVKTSRKKSTDSPREEEKKSLDPDSMRSGARSSLKEALWNRCKDVTDVKVDEKDVEKVAEEIEEALFRLFNKDVGMKYKARYRSLIFNIKDPKNQGLFRKIADRQVTPGQLVKMTAEELASKELAEWRERDAKHQLEIIQKTELEMMNMSNKYLVKTHKGEEIIEETGERKKSEEREIAAPQLEMLQDTTSKHKSHLFDLNCQICSGKIKEEDVFPPNSSKDGERSKSDDKAKKKHRKDTAKKKDDRDRHRSKDASRDKFKDRDKNHEKSRDKDQDKSKDRDREQDRQKDKSSDRKKEKGSEKSKERDEKSKTKERDDKLKEKDKDDKSKEKDKDVKAKEKHNKERKPKLDKDPVSSKKEIEEPMPSKKEVEEPMPSKEEGDESKNDTKELITSEQDVTTTEGTVASEDVTSATVLEPTDHHELAIDQFNKTSVPATEEPVPEKKEVETVKQEPTSTVSIRTPGRESPQSAPMLLWKGVINSSETGKVNVQAFDLSGFIEFGEVEMPVSLDIVGRIRPDMVWDYVNQTRKAGSRDIVVVKFSPCTEADKKNYTAFLSHMHKCNRYAVVGPISKMIKDFYIVPLPKDSPIPSALTSMSLESRIIDENRISLLLGVMVRAKRKRAIDGAFYSKSSKIAKTSRSFTPPLSGSNTASPTINYIPTARSAKRKDMETSLKLDPKRRPLPSSAAESTTDDAPYSPGQLLAEDEVLPTSSSLSEQQAILEELNWKIEEQKMQLATLSAATVDLPISSEDSIVIPGLGEPVIPGLEPDSMISNSLDVHRYSPRPTNSELNQISIPTNLQEILSTIQKKETELKKISIMPEVHNLNFDAEPHGRVVMNSDHDLRQDLFPLQDIDMRIPPPPTLSLDRDPRRTVTSNPPSTTRTEKKSLKQLTDEELLAKALEMEAMEASSSVTPAPVQPYFPTHIGAPMIMPGMQHMQGSGAETPYPMPMMVPPRPYRPPYRHHNTPYNNPTSGAYRPSSKKKR